MEQIVRQRDLFRKLLQDAAGDSSRAALQAVVAGLLPAPEPTLANGSSPKVGYTFSPGTQST